MKSRDWIQFIAFFGIHRSHTAPMELMAIQCHAWPVWLHYCPLCRCRVEIQMNWVSSSTRERSQSIAPQFPPPTTISITSAKGWHGRRSGQPANPLLRVRNVTGQTCMVVFNADRPWTRRLLQFLLASPWTRACAYVYPRWHGGSGIMPTRNVLYA